MGIGDWEKGGRTKRCIWQLKTCTMTGGVYREKGGKGKKIDLSKKAYGINVKYVNSGGALVRAEEKRSAGVDLRAPDSG